MASESVGRSLIAQPARLDEAGVEDAVGWLVRRDPHLAALYQRNGLPPLWARPAEFSTLVLFILEQQVSLASAAAAFARLEASLGVVTPVSFLTLTNAELKTIGFSRQKTGYGRALATAMTSGELDLDSLPAMPDDEVRSVLTRQRGIGPWTADCYLLFVLGRGDAWPHGDRALLVSMAETVGFDEVPSSEAGTEHAERWRPWRSVAARLLWHEYLGGR